MATKATTATVKAGVNHVQALSDFRYGKLRVGRGQVFKLTGARNDEKLVGMKYVARVEKGTELIECGICGALFVNTHWLEVHGNTWHALECECGWTPSPSSAMDGEAQMRRHRSGCETAKGAREEAHRRHVEAAVEASA